MDIKTEIKTLIDAETNHKKLERVRNVLLDMSTEQVLRDKLLNRASLAEKDIQEGRVYSREEIESRLNL